MATEGNLIQIAQVLKSNGIDGELVMSFRDIDPEDIQKNEPVYIDFDGLPVPFFIESLVRRGNTKALVHITDIESNQDAEEVVGKAVYQKAEALGEGEYEDGDFSFLEGWTLLEDENEEVVGTITAFMDIPSNPCLEVETPNGEVIIPLHDDLIINIDEENETLTMVIPDGLLSL